MVSVSGVGADPASKAFSANIGANQAVTVDFDLTPPVTSARAAQVKVDPDNAVKEGNEDNNGATFQLTPPAEPPALAVESAQPQQTTIAVTIINNGGELKATNVTIRLTFGQTTFSTTPSIALTKGQKVTVSIARPAGTGAATVTLLINEQQASNPFPFTIN